MNIGIIGNGFVGGAVYNAFYNNFNTKVYDKNIERRQNDFEQTIDQDLVFICVPTPMKSINGSECNLSILNSVLSEINDKNKRNDNIIVIKSTIPVGISRQLQIQYPKLTIIHSPEFLTAKNANNDFINASRHIFGIPNIKENNKNFSKVIDFFKLIFDKSSIITMDSNESELVKYMCNCFLATKVSFFNEMKLLSDKLNLNWQSIMNGVLLDERIGKSHTAVPGHDGDNGFGGTCFPKDINAMIYLMKNNKLNPLVIEAAWEQNKLVRNNWDWSSEPSAVMEDK